MLALLVLLGGCIGGGLGWFASYIGCTLDHPGTPDHPCPLPLHQCRASRGMIFTITAICAIQGALVTWAVLH